MAESSCACRFDDVGLRLLVVVLAAGAGGRQLAGLCFAFLRQPELRGDGIARPARVAQLLAEAFGAGTGGEQLRLQRLDLRPEALDFDFEGTRVELEQYLATLDVPVRLDRHLGHDALTRALMATT